MPERVSHSSAARSKPSPEWRWRLVGWSGCWIPLFLLACFVTGCATVPARRVGEAPRRADPTRVAALVTELRSLSPGVDLHEAQALADMALNHSLDLAERYGAVRPAVLQNVLVNLKFKDRGLCYHWADDLQAKLQTVGLRTLRLYRVVSKLNTKHEHNSLVVAGRDQRMKQGLVLDAWRHGGRLFWTPVSEDRKYDWQLRQDLPWIPDQSEPGVP
ncbi:MAG: hypothetical protein JNN07_26120 [Verrucomicrobiales bacterium]|nr:hypothetical protein [Verrucomicrobiales bacterium]